MADVTAVDDISFIMKDDGLHIRMKKDVPEGDTGIDIAKSSSKIVVTFEGENFALATITVAVAGDLSLAGIKVEGE